MYIGLFYFWVFICISFVMVIKLVIEMWGSVRKVWFFRNLFLSNCRFLFSSVRVDVNVSGGICIFSNIGFNNWWVGK